MGFGGQVVARTAGRWLGWQRQGPWLGWQRQWARELGGGDPPIQWDNLLYEATPHHGGWGMGLGCGGQVVARTAGRWP